MTKRIKYGDKTIDMPEAMTLEQAKEQMARFFPELAEPAVKTKKDGDNTIYVFSKRAGRKGGAEKIGMKNAYDCDVCGGRIVTINRDDGVTPYLFKCKMGTDCTGLMTSAFYRVSQALEPNFEWYRPDEAERRGLPEEVREHVQMGGLLLRPIQKTVWLRSPGGSGRYA